MTRGWRHARRGAAFYAAALAALGEARAQSFHFPQDFIADLDVYGVALSGGLALFSAVLALAYVAERSAWRKREAEFATKLAQVGAQRDRAEIFLSSEQQLFIAWNDAASEPDIEGSLQLVAEGSQSKRVLVFGSWLAPAEAQRLEQKIDVLRRRGEAFRLTLVGLTGRRYDAEGRAVGGRVLLRLREISGDRLELIGLRERYEESKAEAASLRAFLETLPAPVWLRGADGRIIFANGAYAHAVEAKDGAEAVSRQLELLDQSARAAATQAGADALPWRERVPAIVAGARRLLDVAQAPLPKAAGAIAFDRQEIEDIRADCEQQMQSHRRTLDLLPSAVAIFNGQQQLIYRNAAYEKLWRLDPAFLDSRPTDGEILDRLRLEQRLPLEGDFKSWKARLLQAYRSPEEHTHRWHMPDGRTTIFVKVTPNPKGGVTYLYDDMSERYELESRFNALHRMQHETLETLHEGVAAFGADGRLNFSNPAFAELWRLSGATLEKRPHFEAIANLCRSLCQNDELWRDLRGAVTGLSEQRVGFTRRIERGDGRVLDLSVQPLPQGATLLTFVDVTADVNVERALTDRNKALLAAEKLRNDFIHHVSYELRSPLTNINGFVHLLGEDSTGPLNQRQQEYLSYVRKSSAALLAIVDDILDLATIDENAMELEIEEVDARAAMQSAIEGLQDRLAENKIELQIVAADDVGAFRADAKRVRQILFALLSNAIGFSRPGQTVTLAALRRDNDVIFKIVDRGRGISPEILERVFDRFESHTTGSRHRGVGLGLSIVRAFMALHGGKVLIDSAPGEGTTVTCIFPAEPTPLSTAAAPPQKLAAPRRQDEIAAREVMRAASDRVAASMQENGVKLRLLEASKHGVVFGDEQELCAALADLLSDAMESTRVGQAITFASFERPTEIAFKITDRGGGVDNRRAAARKLIEANGGKMFVDSVAGEGLTITCVFPNKTADAAKQSGERAS
ncbi:MAG TPA: ATP-binding protein [Methylocystis sp.]|nr:ATP-binding protein [Methylocystis sp.]